MLFCLGHDSAQPNHVRPGNKLNLNNKIDKGMKPGYNMLLSSNGTRTIISPIIDGGWNPSGSTNRCDSEFKNTQSWNQHTNIVF